MIEIEKRIEEHIEVIEAIRPLIPDLAELGRRMSACLSMGRKILWMGNGGSAADSQHLAAELVGRFSRERKGLASVALTTDTSILTAVGNDYGYDKIFSRQVEAICKPGDIVVGLSTSGNSPNVLEALRAARKLGALTVGLSGNDGGSMLNEADYCLIAPSKVTARIQEAHILMGHILCDWVEAAVVDNPSEFEV